MNREAMIRQINAISLWDICVVGGGATGIATALDAASRGLKTILLERSDFAKGTSSRSTKLVHGGVRYLRQGNIKLVKEALRERGLLIHNAPHLVHNRPFIVPAYKWWEKSFYGIGLKFYDALAGSQSLGNSRILSKKETLDMAPTLEPSGLRGGVIYHDGQFDDARLAMSMALQATKHGAVLLNYCSVEGFLKLEGKIAGVDATDLVSGAHFEIHSKVVINATGVFADKVLELDKPGHEALIRPSQGMHIVVEKKILPVETAVMIPRTSDGRVLFAVPWHDKVVIGTTDTAINQIEIEPVPLAEETEFLLHDAGKYFSCNLKKRDIKSQFAGLRPLVRGGKKNTAALSRDYLVTTSGSGLITITGGKWTTCRKMAEQVINVALKQEGLHAGPCITQNLQLGDEAEMLIPASIEGATQGQLKNWVDHAVKNEMCVTVEDFLSRRTRQLILDAGIAMEKAEVIAELLGETLNRNVTWKQEQIHIFKEIAQNYLPKPK